MTQLNRLSRLFIILAAIAAVSVAFAGTASAASKDYSSPDGICYTSGWCHWNEVCYDAFGGCYFDFWCPNGASSASQCLYYGGFAPYATASSSASGDGVITGGTFTIDNGNTSSASSDTITGGSFDINNVVEGDTIGYDNGCGLFSCIIIGSGGGSDSRVTSSLNTLLGWQNPLIVSGLTAAYYALNPY
jgi:hypothetical protein